MICLAVLVLSLPVWSTAKVEDDKQRMECTRTDDQVISAFDGWPQLVNCIDASNDSQYDYNDEDETIMSCQIWSNNSLLFNETFDWTSESRSFITPDLEFNKTQKFLLRTQNGSAKCVERSVSFDVRPLPYTSCNESLELISPGPIYVVEREPTALKCFVEATERPELQSMNLPIIWLYNCQSNLPLGVEVRKQQAESAEELSIDSVRFEHPGIYTCAVVYKGRTQYVRHVPICVKEKNTLSPPSLKCQKSTYLVEKLGQNISIECVVDMGLGREDDVLFTWEKVRPAGAFKCYNQLGKNTVPRNPKNSLHRCLSTPGPKKSQCHPTNQKGSTPLIVKSLLYLINIQKEDLGEYRMKFKSLYTVTVTVKLDDAPKVERSLLLIELGVGIALFLVIIIAVLFVFRFYLKVYWKMWCGPYESDDKTYTVFLSYYFNTEQDTFAQQQARDLCATTRIHLETLKCSVYDEHFDGGNLNRAENLITVMDTCHRVVILLTADYVKDHWKVFELQQGFKAMIESGSKIIFIVVPGMRRYIDQQASVDDTFRMIQRAVEINRNISWSPKMNERFRSFHFHLLYSLPKLRPHVPEEKKVSLLLDDSENYEEKKD